MSVRRRTLVIFAVCLALVGAVVGVVRLDTWHPVLREVVVPVRGLTREVTLVQASDLHAMQFGAGQSEIADLLRGRRVDAAVMTGDMLDFQEEDRKPAYDLAAVLRNATPRVYFIAGNHDPIDLGVSLAAHGVKPLAPGSVMPLTAADGDARDVGIVYGRDSASIREAGGSASQLLVIASHTAPNATRLSTGASLSAQHLFIAGHTHGGQIRLPLIGALRAPTSWAPEEGGVQGTNEFLWFPDLRGYPVAGMYERDGQQVYVSTGLGCTLLHTRFLDRSSLVLYRFVPKDR